MRSVAFGVIKRLTRCGLAALPLLHASLASAHWPGQPEHQFADLGEFHFEDGGAIPNLRMSYVTHGTLNAQKDNAILFMHGWAANHHSADHLIGPGKALDTDKYFLICPDELGNPQTTLEHSTSPTSSGLNTLRFYALRLHEVGMIKTAPNQLIAQGTDWRFVNELKRELKA